MDNNPFDALDGPDDVLTPAPDPTLAERLKINFKAAQRGNTVLGAVRANMPMHASETARMDARYEAFPEWQGFIEGAAALTGQIAGTAASPENFIPIGLGEKLFVAGKAGVTGLWAKVFAGAVDGAAANAVADAAIQGMDIAGGTAEGFDPQRYAAGILLGAGIGGAAPALVAGGKSVIGKAAGKTAPTAVMPEANPFDALDEALPPAAEAPVAAAAETAAVKAAPVETAPVKAAPVETAPVNAAPVETAPVNAAPVETAPVNAAPVETAPVNAVPVETAPVKAAPVEAPVVIDPLAAGAETAIPDMLGERLSAQASAARGADDFMAGKRMVYQTIAGETVNAKRVKAGGETGAGGVEIRAGREADGKVLAAPMMGASQVRNFADTVVKTSPIAEFLDMAAPHNHAPGRAAAGVAGKAEASIAGVRDTADALAKALDVHATRQGRMQKGPGSAGKLGQYGVQSGVVRVKSINDFDTLTHEYGHHLERRVPAAKAFIAAHAQELEKLDYDPAKGRDYEGFAEFFRLWVTNRKFAEKQHPALSADFARLMEANPEIRAGIDAASKAWDEFLAAPSTAAVQSTIVSSKKQGWLASAPDALKKNGVGGTIADVLGRLYTFFWDDLNPLNKAVRHLQALHLEHKGKPLDINVSRDPYKLARMSRGAYASGHMDVMYGVAPYRGVNPESPSLRDAIIAAMGSPNALSRWDEVKAREFGGYLWSRRALGEWERYDAGDIPNPPDRLTRGDHQVNVAEMEKANPQFAAAASAVHEFARALWKKKRDAGLIDDDVYQAGLAIKDYVPGLRDFSGDSDVKVSGKAQGKSGEAKGGFVKRFRGSKRDVINPLESLAADAYETAMAIARNDVVKALDRLALTAGPGGGAIAERIPAHEMRATMIDPIEAVETAAKNAGLGPADIVMLRDAIEGSIGADKAAIFRPAMINEKGEPVVFFRDGGELRALRLADGEFGKAMYGALTTMSRSEKNFWLDLVSVPARVLRMGITTSMEFIGANFVRDQTMAWVYYGKLFRRVGASLQGAADDLMGSDTARAYSRVYGLSGGQETASLSAAMAERDISKLKRKGWAAQRLTSWRGILQVTETSETATRLGLFRTFVKEARARGLDENEAAFEAAWRARDYIDFDRRGSGMAALARVVPFLNVALQGLDKTSRTMLNPLAKKMLGQNLDAADARAMGEAAKAWARLSVLAAGALSLYALASRHEDHDEISEATRSTHFMIKTGEKWVAVPKPFEFATVINLAEAAFDTMVKNDPAALGRWTDSLYTTLMPPSLIEGNPAIKSWFELRTNTNLFTGAPIVPENLQGMEPFLQYTARTSELAKQFGAWFDVSPLAAEHLFVSHLGSWGRTALSLYDLAQPDAPAFAWDDAPISRRFIKDAAKGSQSVTQFWELAGEGEGRLEGKVKSWRMLADSGDAAGAADFYAGLDPVAKAYVAVSALDAKARRLHPMIRARGGIQAIGAIRREMAGGRLTDGEGNPIAVSPQARTAADDILGTLTMAMARNAQIATGIPGWAQRAEIDEYGFYRELEAVSPALRQRLADGFATENVWDWNAVKAAWPDLRERALADGSAAEADDLVWLTEAQGFALPDGEKRKRAEKPELTPGG